MVQNGKFNVRGPHYYKGIIYFKNDWHWKNKKKMANGRQMEKVEILPLSYGQSYSTNG